jgi:hypothetical protein
MVCRTTPALLVRYRQKRGEIHVRKLIALSAALVGALLVLVAPAGAVKYGQPDGTAHPYVGLVVFSEDGVPLWGCSGTLLSATKFLTAGHCTGVDAASGARPDHAEVWFDPGYPNEIPYGAGFPAPGPNPCAGVTGYPCSGDVGGTPVTSPGWTGTFTPPNTHDLGVVLLDSPFSVPQYAELPPVGLLDGVASKRGQQDVEFTIVGYGLQSVKPVVQDQRTRMRGTVSLVTLSSAFTDGWNVRVSDNPGQGHGGSGGACFGDSGGPLLQGNTIVGVNSFGLNKNCSGSSYFYRVDTQPAQDFINGTN